MPHLEGKVAVHILVMKCFLIVKAVVPHSAILKAVLLHSTSIAASFCMPCCTNPKPPHSQGSSALSEGNTSAPALVAGSAYPSGKASGAWEVSICPWPCGALLPWWAIGW